jgi:hypothetical protein
MAPLRNPKFADSLLEGSGFEPSVPVGDSQLLTPISSRKRGKARQVDGSENTPFVQLWLRG